MPLSPPFRARSSPAIVLREQPDQAARVVVSEHGMRTRVYVHPDTLAILKIVPEEGRFERTVARIHGELLMGNAGSILVELAASWAIVMVLTGLYLWWPRQAKGLAGVLYPRIGQGAKRFWRDLHAVTGIWVSAFALFLLATGLPWALVWGNGLKQVRAWTGTAAISQDWFTSSAGEHAEHMHHDTMTTAPTSADAPIDLIVARAEQLKLASPVMLTPPTKDAAVWWAKSNAQNRPHRQDVALDPTTGDVVGRNDFGEKHVIDQVIGFGLAAHEGQLFGPLNQALGVLTALGLVTLCVSAFVMWRRRSPEGVLGAPPPIPDAKVGYGLAILILVAAILLPVLGASLLLLALVERGVLMCWPAARRWLGLSPAWYFPPLVEPRRVAPRFHPIVAGREACLYCNVMIVEDEPLIGMMMEALVSDIGGETLGVYATVASALAAAETLDQIDVALLDCNLGKEASWPVADVLAARGVPFAFSSGQAKKEIAERFSGRPVFAKPVDEQKLRRFLRRFVRQA